MPNRSKALGLVVVTLVTSPLWAGNMRLLQFDRNAQDVTGISLSDAGRNGPVSVMPVQTRISGEQMPVRGMSMEQVESSYGAPLARRAPVGDPPITRWEYQSFIVFFEYKRVIHSVQKRP